MSKSLLSAIIASAVFLLMFLSGCRKIDVGPKNENVQLDYSTFNPYGKLEPSVKRVYDHFIKLQKSTDVFRHYTQKYGRPLWEKGFVIQSGGNSNQQRNVENDTVVIIPVIQSEALIINSYIEARLSDSITLWTHSADEYSMHEFSTSDEIKHAEQIALQFMLINRDVFGYRVFEITDKRLFNFSPDYSDTGALKINIVLKDSTEAAMRVRYVELCVDVIVTKPCPEPPPHDPGNEARETTPCTITSTVTVCAGWWEDDHGGEGGGGSGGGDTGGGQTGGGGGGGTGGGGGGGGWTPLPSDQTELTLTDIQNFKNASALIAISEQSAGITTANFGGKVFLTDQRSQITAIGTQGSFKIQINKHNTIEKGMLSYAHELSNANRILQMVQVYQTAYNSPKNAQNELAFATGLGTIEAYGYCQQVLVALEMGTTHLLNNDIVAVVSSAIGPTPSISMNDAAAYIFNNYIKTGLATDDTGYSTWQGYLDQYATF